MDPFAYTKRTIIKKQLDSEALGKERSLWIYLPPGYNELQTYPVVYCQDGIEFFNFGRIATHTNYLVLEEDMEPPIIVGIAVDLPNRSQEYSPAGDRYAAYCRFITEELLPFIEGEFPVRNDNDGRILAGDSLGGTVSLHLALDYPELFHKVIALSGAFLDPTLRILAEKSDLSFLDLYMLIGLEENEVKTDWGSFDFLTFNRQAKKLLTDKNAQLVYKETNGRHIWGFWQNELQEALKHFLKSR
ncbi:alpha/beta hydrolase [Gorillibacterium massiliense]|uniref:alpha/beta hydrolase n=1 Tax=Gorillibacterium massiliense TaxID=1280390 RepID=UPI0004ACE56C|nr:alpha/beta hydrolase-fold protein [Gorillibacterium massiliense]